MNQRIFLGGNTCRGFYSLYEGFPPDKTAFLHILKGGPGTGKSGFMKRLAAEAEARGYDVQTVLCSGDPDSLDGVYIPALRLAWADGTAPHTLDARFFGVDSDYVNLGRFVRPLSVEDGEAVRRISAACRACYEEAYDALRRAKALHDELEAVYRPYVDFPALTDYTEQSVRELFGEET